MEAVLVEKARQYALAEIKNYSGNLGHKFFRAMILALERQAKDACETNPKLRKNALLLGVYFHELGRLKSEGDDHTKHSVQLFEDFIKDATVSSETKEIVHDCCYNHLEDGIPFTKEGKFIKNWHWAITFEPEALLARLEDLQEKGHSYKEAKQELFDALEYEYRSIADDDLKEHARETLRLLKESLE